MKWSIDPKKLALRAAILAAAIAAALAVGSGCITRPIVSTRPDTNTVVALPVTNQSIDKIDILFMIDNSASMGDKQKILAQAVPDMLTRLVTPDCVDAKGNPFSPNVTADSNGQCAEGSPEFAPVHDMHIGVLSSSLGARGGAGYCPEDPPPQSAASASAAADGGAPTPPHNDDHGELLNRGGDNEHVVTDALPDNFLAWLPDVPANTGATQPPVVAIKTVDALVSDFTDMVTGVHERGCGFEAMNEAWYRFLIDPKPYASIDTSSGRAVLTGVDDTILKQRHDFLRPDSLVVVVVVTDEWGDETVDPLALGGHAWEFANADAEGNGAFPGSPTGYSPEGTLACSAAVDPSDVATTGPNASACTTCAGMSVAGLAASCASTTGGKNGYLAIADDEPNIRFFQPKRRFGVDITFPTSRYVRGLTRLKVASADHEHDGNGVYDGDQDSAANCVNPLYAASLPSDSSEETCNLPPGSRTTDRVFYAAITGVPHQLLQVDAGDPNSLQKDTLSEADWLLVTGRDPEHYDFSGADFHMIESTAPRTAGSLPAGVIGASSCPPGSADDCDPINGREWDTADTEDGSKAGPEDLEYACTFPLLPPGKDCSLPIYAGACDCGDMTPIAGSGKTPLCAKDGGQYDSTQINGKAYPGIQHATIAHALSPAGQAAHGILSSLCPIHTTMSGPADPLYGYRPATTAIVDRLKTALNSQCLPQALDAQPDGSYPCALFVSLAPDGVDTCKQPGAACSGDQGLSDVPDPTVLDDYCDGREQIYLQGGGAQSGAIDPLTQPVCQVNQLNPVTQPQDFDSNGSCVDSNDPGWCYVDKATSPNATTCPHAVLFTKKGELPSAVIDLRCIEAAVTVVTGGG